MKKAIGKYFGDFVALLAMLVLGLGVGGYILSNQRLRFPLIEDKPFPVKAVLPDAQAVQPGQGQTVRSAGVEIGQIGKVELEDGRAVVELALEQDYKGFIRKDATALLRTKTGLKDMFIEVDPGEGEPLEENERIQVSNTLPDIDPDEILSALDTDTRAYLQLLVSGLGKGLDGRGSDLRETFARLGPLNRDLARLSKAVARRKDNLKRLVNRYGLLTEELGTKDREIVRLVQASNTVFEALAAEDQNISRAVRELPGALGQTSQTLAKVDTLGTRLPPGLEALREPLRNLDVANRDILPLFREATPQIRNQIRPFARVAPSYTRDLGLAARDLAKAGPDLTQSFDKLNRFFNIGAFNPGGAEGLGGKTFAQQRDREEGYLYWLAQAAQVTGGLFANADGRGVLRRIEVGGINCAIFAGAGLPAETVTLLGLLGLCSN